MKKNIALYDPFLDVMGGGEKHILSILQVLENAGFGISIFWNQDLSQVIQNNLNLSFQHLTFLPNIFTFSSPFKKIGQLKDFDMFLYVTDGSYFISSAKKNVIFCMVPNKALYRMTLKNKIKTLNTVFVSNSTYTQLWLKKWGITSSVIYPYVTNDLLKTNLAEIKKEEIILSVGRFFGHLHTKKHEEIINTFLMFQKTHPQFKLVLIGGLKDEDKPYYESLVNHIGNNKHILLKPNLPYHELIAYYKKSMFFWHFAGYGIDEIKHPERVEHLGMTPLEAMAAGTIPFCYRAGGPKEIITDGENGFLFETQSEILLKTTKMVQNISMYDDVAKNGQKYINKHFSYEVFEKKVKAILL